MKLFNCKKVNKWPHQQPKQEPKQKRRPSPPPPPTPKSGIAINQELLILVKQQIIDVIEEDISKRGKIAQAIKQL